MFDSGGGFSGNNNDNDDGDDDDGDDDDGSGDNGGDGGGSNDDNAGADAKLDAGEITTGAEPPTTLRSSSRPCPPIERLCLVVGHDAIDSAIAEEEAEQPAKRRRTSSGAARIAVQSDGGDVEDGGDDEDAGDVEGEEDGGKSRKRKAELSKEEKQRYQLMLADELKAAIKEHHREHGKVLKVLPRNTMLPAFAKKHQLKGRCGLENLWNNAATFAREGKIVYRDCAGEISSKYADATSAEENARKCTEAGTGFVKHFMEKPKRGGQRSKGAIKRRPSSVRLTLPRRPCRRDQRGTNSMSLWRSSVVPRSVVPRTSVVPMSSML